MRAKSLLFVAILVLLGVASFGVQPARADELGDPTIEIGVISSLPSSTILSSEDATTATEGGLTWTVANQGGIYYAYFENTGTSTWTDMTIAVTDGGTATSGVSYTQNAFQSSIFATGTTAAFGTPTSNTSICTSCTPGDVYDFDYTGGTGVGVDDYMVVRFNGFPQGPPDSSFTFTASTDDGTAVPEPSSIAMLGVGLLGLLGLATFTRRRSAGIEAA